MPVTRPYPSQLNDESTRRPQIAPVPPFLGYVEFVANPIGGTPAAPTTLAQLDGFDILQLDGSSILVI